MINKNYEKFIADNDEYTELSYCNDELYENELDKELYEDENSSVLIVTPTEEQDYYAICDWLEESSYVAQETKNRSFVFFEDTDLIEHLEEDLYRIFEDLSISVTIK